MTHQVKTPQHLYNDTPPTILRNREEKFRTAKDNPFWLWFAEYVFTRMVKARFHSFMYKGIENLEQRDKTKAIIFYTNHNNWWDGIIGFHVARLIMKGRLRLMIEEMNRFPLFQYIGCFPVNKKTPQDAIKALKYAATTLDKPDINFWLFPQGIIRPPHYRPEVFQSGLAYLVQNAVKNFGGVNICPVSVNYTFLRQDKPEVVMEFGNVQTFYEFNEDRKAFCHRLEREFEQFCDNQQLQISKGNFEGYRYLFIKKLSWWRDIERKLKNIGMKDNDKQ
ncbi:MAG: lysophospholipid acyltransferase family protein [Candidatus Gastranaerophilales bacterium]|nr:lysophospholipid acyltransferase family protein [Candidatus Gastranaerophilales bacterium]